ncbi:MAG: ubiquinol-cytochrome C chaperone family protein [Pseudomonadota bacterium]
MFRIFSTNTPDPAVTRLYDRAVAQARQPIFYQSFDVPDTLQGRFDMVVFHVSPLIDRLRDEKGAISPKGQALFDTFVADMEQNLRTIGIGDTSVPKKMKQIGEAFYGRFDAYRSAGEDRAALAAAVARNIFDNPDKAQSPVAHAMAAYHMALREAAEGDTFETVFPDPLQFHPDAGALAPSEEAQR